MQVTNVPLTAVDVKREARLFGFDLCGIAPAAAHPELGFLREWLDRGYAADMLILDRAVGNCKIRVAFFVGS